MPKLQCLYVKKRVRMCQKETIKEWEKRIWNSYFLGYVKEEVADSIYRLYTE
jgi:hypothetical protein